MRELTQREIAELSGVSFRMIKDYEQGQRDINGAKLLTLLKLCLALRCRLEDIVDDTETLELLSRYYRFWGVIYPVAS